jgi:uncharacterized protein (DUF305 family)
MKTAFHAYKWYRTTLRWSIVSLILLSTVAVAADTPGRGRTGSFEVAYLQFIINHHASALRMTELAAGTDVTRDAMMQPTEGTSPTPGYPTTAARSRLEQIKSMARMANRAQREEIAKAQRMLKEWYGVDARPAVTPEGQQMIDALERVSAGVDFDRAFLAIFSQHHYGALKPSVDCQVNRELEHDDLDRYCRGIVHAQINEITEMRKMLCKEFNVCDLQLPQ